MLPTIGKLLNLLCYPHLCKMIDKGSESLQKTRSLEARDQQYIWHPLTQHKVHPTALPIVKAQGVYLTDASGKNYIDGISSWYIAVYGHCNPYIVKKVEEQMQQLDQVVFSGFTHEPAIALSESLIEILPENQEKIFFSDNGSTSVEVALKMAFQYHFNRGQKRNVVLAFEEGFHGDTFGAMSASGLSVYNGPFEDFFIEVHRIPVPTPDNIQRILADLKDRLEHQNIASFVYEPLVQGAAGMKMYGAKELQQILNVLQKHQVLCIADEVMTGFGKTGTFFASDQVEVKPDILCLSKALTAGLLPMGITSCSQKVFNAFYDNDISKGFFHGHTYSANPLACAAALAGIELLQSKEIQDNLKKIATWHTKFARVIKQHPKVKSVRHLGAIFALDLEAKAERYGKLRDELFDHFMDNGVFLRPLGNTIYILAPYVTTKKQMQTIYKTIKNALTLV